MQTLIAALDQGTSSTRVILFDHSGGSAFCHQVEVKQQTPRPGWVEEDPEELYRTCKECLGAAEAWATARGARVVGLGVTNQRETTVAWDRKTGAALCNAVVWLDTRTKQLVEDLTRDRAADVARVRAACGLPVATYFSALKMRWLIDNVPAVAAAARDGRLALGTVDSWIVWRLTAGASHVTDVTNASRTMLMDVRSLRWDDSLCQFFGVPRAALPEIRSSSEQYGSVADGAPFKGVPIAGCLGDQQAALVGQLCLRPGLAKNTYGTGCFMLRNTGSEVVQSGHGLLTTVAYQLGPKAQAAYALEGSVAIAGAAVQWLRDNLGLISDTAQINELAASVADTGGVYLVPAFSGLFAPYWRPDARGVIVGITQFTTKAHIARAVFEATCFQTLEVLNAMEADIIGSGNSHVLTELRVDGGMTKSDLLVQLQADVLGIPAARPDMRETTALGAAIAAGLAIGFWSLTPDGNSVSGITRTCTPFTPTTTPEERQRRLARWKMAVERSLNWV